MDSLSRAIIVDEDQKTHLLAPQMLTVSGSTPRSQAPAREFDVLLLGKNPQGGVDEVKVCSRDQLAEITSQEFQRLFRLAEWAMRAEDLADWLGRFPANKLALLTKQQVDQLLESEHGGLRRWGIRASQFRGISTSLSHSSGEQGV